MALYFFHLTIDHAEHAGEGVELADDGAALNEAVRIALTYSRDWPKVLASAPLSLRVTAEGGRLVTALAVSALTSTSGGA